MPVRTTALVAALLLIGAVLPSARATVVGETCQGHPATIVGAGREVVGTPGDDVIVSGASRFVIADAGNDIICITPTTNASSVHIDAGEGDDAVNASPSNARALAAELGSGRDRYIGGRGVDIVYSDGLDDWVSSGLGADSFNITVTSAEMDIRGRYDGGPGSAKDILGVASDTFDLEVELVGKVAIDGVTAADTIRFEDAVVRSHRAVLRGNAGDNYLAAAGCNLLVVGGAGNDDVSVSYRETKNPDGQFKCDHRYRKSMAAGGSGHDRITGYNGHDRLVGNAGNDTIRGRPSPDLLLGGPGHDLLYGDGGNDVIRGHSGDDTLFGGPDRDTAQGNAGRDRCIAERARRCER